MPPNAKGGKGYKKKKKAGDGEPDPTINFLDAQEDQMVARVIRLLGNRNVLCFCNDNRLRVCHICGRMKGRVWIEPGDMVLVSLRDFRTGVECLTGRGSAPMRGDIVGKYVAAQLSDLRRKAGVNERLFMSMETMDGLALGEVGVDLATDKRLKGEDEMGGFVFESRPDGDGSSSGSEEEKPAELKGPARPRGGRAMEATAAAGGAGDDDLDIDAI